MVVTTSQLVLAHDLALALPVVYQVWGGAFVGGEVAGITVLVIVAVGVTCAANSVKAIALLIARSVAAAALVISKIALAVPVGLSVGVEVLS